MRRAASWSRVRYGAGIAALVLALSVTLAVSASAQWQISSPDGKASLKFGYLFQGRAEWDRADTDPDATTAQNLYLRRARLLFGGRINERLSFFAETDAPNLGKAGADGTKEFADVYLQDCMATWSAKDAFLFDFGLLLTPGLYNHVQSAASLLALDYGPYTFVESTPLKAKIGRDIGMQARGVVGQKHFEYRVAMLQGIRGVGAQSSFRFAGRLAYTPYQAANALFYSGTSLGKSKAFSLGVSADAQRDYLAYGVDAFADCPFDAKTALTLQASWCHYDGGDFLGGTQYATTNIFEQDTYMVEAGLTLVPQKVTPYVQVAGRLCDGDVVGGLDERSVQIGLAYWLDGHKSNLKAAYSILTKDGNPDHGVLSIQCQAFSY